MLSYEFTGVRIGLLRVRHLQQNVGVAGLVERTPAGQVFPAQAGPKVTLVERFTRVDSKTIDYQYTVSDPTSYSRAWTASMPLRAIDGNLYEYACHEGNYGMMDVLRGARYREKEGK